MHGIRIGLCVNQAVRTATERDGLDTRLYISKNGDKLRSDWANLSGKLLRCFGKFPRLSALGPVKTFIDNIKTKYQNKNLTMLDAFVRSIAAIRGVKDEELFAHIAKFDNIRTDGNTVFSGRVAHTIRLAASKVKFLNNLANENLNSPGSAPTPAPTPAPSHEETTPSEPAPVMMPPPPLPPLPPLPPPPSATRVRADKDSGQFAYISRTRPILRREFAGG